MSVAGVDGAVAIVSGTGPNIGAAVALALAAAGARVAAVDRSPEHAEACARDIRDAGGTAAAVAGDVTSDVEVVATLDRIESSLGPVTILVNGAGTYRYGGVLDLGLDDWQEQLAVILDGAFLCTKHVASRLVAAGLGGSIINVSSTAGHQGEAGNIGYSTAKAGLLNFTRSAAVELAPMGVRVNSLTPSATDPDEAIERRARWGSPVSSDEADARRRLAARSAAVTPMRRLPSPSDYGAAAVFLASDAAAMITGTDLRVDGGAVAQYWRTFQQGDPDAARLAPRAASEARP